MPSLISSAVGMGASALGSQQAAEQSVRGAQRQADIEAQARQASRAEFERQMGAQQPYVDVGAQALPGLVSAVSNRLDTSGLPAERIQGTLISEFLGDMAPQYVKDRALGNLGAIEAEKTKNRLADLVNIGVGGTGSTAAAGVDLGTTLASSLNRSGAATADALNQAAINRQNLYNQTVTGLAGLPAYLSARNNQPATAYPSTTIPQSGYFNPRDLAR